MIITKTVVEDMANDVNEALEMAGTEHRVYVDMAYGGYRVVLTDVRGRHMRYITGRDTSRHTWMFLNGMLAFAEEVMNR